MLKLSKFLSFIFFPVSLFAQQARLVDCPIEQAGDVCLWDKLTGEKLKSLYPDREMFENCSSITFERAFQKAGCQLVDVRTKAEFDEGHIPGAILINVNQDDFDLQVTNMLQTGKPVAVYCRGGVRSRKASEKLLLKGFQVYNLDRGYLQWVKDGKEEAPKMGKALLVIDMQLGVFMRKEYDGMAIYQEEQLLQNVAGLIEKARNSGVAVIFIQHMYQDFPLMDKGQPLWNVHPAISPEEKDVIIEKNHADAFYDSALEEILKQKGIGTLVITGIQTAYCVDSTCRSAYSKGYNCILVSDGHSTLDSEILPAEKIIAHHNEVLGSQFAKVMNASVVEF
jgi:nicotinamidase-related amidase/rhodanese-related sulfurtransferase